MRISKFPLILISIVIAILLFWYVNIRVKAEADYFLQPNIIRCTCYCVDGTTASGQHTRANTVAGKKEWLGCVALLYEVDENGEIGDFIGYYEFIDTGYGINGSLIDGTSIDVWQPSLDACYDWVGKYGDYVYMQIVRGEG